MQDYTSEIVTSRTERLTMDAPVNHTELGKLLAIARQRFARVHDGDEPMDDQMFIEGDDGAHGKVTVWFPHPDTSTMTPEAERLVVTRAERAAAAKNELADLLAWTSTVTRLVDRDDLRAEIERRIAGLEQA